MEPTSGTVPLGLRVRHWLDDTPVGLALDLLSSVLSVLVISAYIVRGAMQEGGSHGGGGNGQR